MRKVNFYRLHIVPFPGKRFGPEEAQNWVEEDLRRLAYDVLELSKSDSVADRDRLYFTLEDMKTMAKACTRAAAGNLDAVFARTSDWELSQSRLRILDAYEAEEAASARG